MASKPHFAESEKLVSAITTNSVPCLQCQTISQYVYININIPDVASFVPRPVDHLFLTERGLRVKEAPKTDMQAWFQKGFETDSLTDEREDYNEKKL